MKKTEISHAQRVLDEKISRQIDEAIKPMELTANRKEALRMRIFDRIDQDQIPQSDLLLTIRHDQGNWIQIAPKIEKKQLYVDYDKNIETYLLKVQPGGEAPGHTHQQDEFCMVLEGSLDFDESQLTAGDEIHLSAGDCQLARRGSSHGHAHCPEGALLYMQSALEEKSII